MGIFRVEKVKDYTTISNYHLRDKNLSLKAKGLLTLILALPEDWNFTIRGLSAICKEGAESIGTALKELEKGGYLVRKRVRGIDGRMSDTEYNFYEEPVRQMEEPSEGSDDGQSGTEEPESEISEEEQPHTEKPDAEKTAQSNTHVSKTYPPNTHKSNPYPSHLQTYEADGYDGMGNCVDVQTWNRIRSEVEKQICFEAYEGTRNGSVINEIVELMTEIYCMPGGMMRISGVPYSVEVVKKRFRELTSSHIDTLLWSMKRSSREIRNIRGYLLTSLFQAPTTKENIFEADMRYRGVGLMRKNEITEENNMFFNYVCELKTTSNMAGTMVFGDLLQNCVNQRLFETYNAPEYERIQMLHKLSGLYSEAYENTALFFGEEPVEVRFFGVPGGDEDDFMLNAVTRLEDGRCFLFSADDDFMQSYVGKQRFMAVL